MSSMPSIRAIYPSAEGSRGREIKSVNDFEETAPRVKEVVCS
jgi:hypothetical protein